MSDYDFSQLSPHDFEIMCRDLLQAEWGLTLESFKAGKDGGIDFRYANAGKQIIVQCKRFVATGFDGLLRELRKEADKVKKLKPGRYILMTAASLSDANKTRIVEVIGAEYLDKSDIFGRDDLNNLLGKHTEVERAHYKLWLASTNVLETVLHNDIVTQSDFQVEKIHGEIKRYVQGNAYPRAMAALKADHVVILSGLPGVGKTTLANMLLYEHLANGFEPIVLRQYFAEGKAMFRKGKPQVFYFDDFMGTTFLGDKGSSDQQREYRAIVEFIEMVGASKDKRLILTTREQMLRQAWGASEQIRNAGLIDRKVVIQMGDYNLRQRAEILYNHVFFSDLPPEYRDELLKGEFYFKIVKHDKFNPRLIEWLSTYRRLKAVPVERYQAFVTKLLHDPSEIWRHAYEQQISDAGRSLLLTMFSFGGKAGDALLCEGFAALHAHRAQKYGLPRNPNDYTTARAELHGAFVRPSGVDTIEFINPSVQDWLNRVVRTEPDNVVDLMVGAVRFTQIAQVWNFVQSAVGGATRDALRNNIGQIAPHVAALATAQRAFQHPQGFVYTAPTYEERLATTVRMADALRTPALLPVIEGVIERLKEERTATLCEIDDTIAAVKAYESASWDALQAFQPFFDDCASELIESAEHSCGANELRALLGQYEDSQKPIHPFKDSLKKAFDGFLSSNLSDEIRNCQSGQDFDALIDHLEYFGRTFDVDVDNQVGRVREALDEHTDYEEQRADQEMDEYKEQSRATRANEDGIREMFGSLRSDN
ncbi:restriction endonuclease [Sphingomonadaceae bacterium G21617-S1]|nr:restriction endonuclease [Sphingomonadaceae bacterium G21617-S1]